MPIKVGFLIGKDTDLVEDAKYVGDSAFLADLPDKYRVDPESKEYLKNCEEGTKGFAHADVAIPWYIHKHFDDIEVDMIFPEDITMKRLRSNLVNFVIGYDVINSVFEGPERYDQMTRMFKACGNVMPSWKVQDFIYYKSKYMQACIDSGVPMAPTIFSFKGQRTPAGLLKQIKARGWKTFVMKQSMMAFSLGFKKLTVEECEKDPKILRQYFKDFPDCPEYVVQEAIEGFTRNWETRVFWYNGEFLYAIANKAAVSTEDGQEQIVTGDDIPDEFLENAKRIGSEALKVLPQLTTPNGHPVPMTLIRTDIGCSDSQVHDKDTNWDPNSKTFFLNEIEYGGTTYFIRHLKFDAMPMWAELYVKKTREIHERMQEAPVKPEAEGEPKAKRARTQAAQKKPAAAVLKKPARA
uniref:ATP-grasp domain-containing protein n=1 Tax=Alexandrium catenella TaxID=2925 RepID=A0A7S1M5E7_ALECA|mmetsp:Transcript_20314/g.55373  ORF Transcript_20314/g.55373 Transcript_20314/m.55373 type:complete len:409 (+) Transcript_20314:77-1303(+)